MNSPYQPKVDPAQFTDMMTNRYFPLVPGTVMVYEGKRDGLPLRIELTVTNDTKDIIGVRTIVVRDIVTGALEERTSDWYGVQLPSLRSVRRISATAMRAGRPLTTDAGEWLASASPDRRLRCPAPPPRPRMLCTTAPTASGVGVLY